MRAAIEASGTQMVTVALRRIDLEATGGPDILEFIDRERVQLLPNTSGAVDAAYSTTLIGPVTSVSPVSGAVV